MWQDARVTKIIHSVVLPSYDSRQKIAKNKTKSTRRFVYWSEPGVEQRGHNSDLLFLPRYTEELLVHRDVLAAHVKTVEPIVA